MSNIRLQGNPSGTGTLTIASPNTNSDFTLNLPASNGTLLDSTGSTTLTNLTVTNGASIQGLTVGRGAGAVSTNTAVGTSALAANTTGAGITVVGADAYTDASTASNNTALGWTALKGNTTGNFNTAIGGGQVGVARGALGNNTTGANNTAVGHMALQSNTTASGNTALGYQAGYSNTTGTNNTALGIGALYSNGTTSGNTAIGASTLAFTTSGTNNTAVGFNAGNLLTTGSKNTILGGYNGNQSGLDIRTTSNFIVLSDGDGNPRLVGNGSGQWVMGATTNNGYERLYVVNSNVTAGFYRSGTTANVGLVEWRNDSGLCGSVNTDGTTTRYLTSADPTTSAQFIKEGVQFPATQNASSNANTLDDYEEGTWTPTLGGNTTYIDRSGGYVKIGRFVWLNFLVRVSVIGTGSATTITGLPFAFNGFGGPRSSGACNYFTNTAIAVTSLSWNVDANGIFAGTTSGSTGFITDGAAIFTNGTYIMGSVTYCTS